MAVVVDVHHLGLGRGQLGVQGVQLLGETDEGVNSKVKAAFANQLVPIVCCGETEEERDAGETEAVLRRQLEADLAELEAEGAKSDVRRKVKESGEREMRQIRDKAQREIDRLERTNERAWTRVSEAAALQFVRKISGFSRPASHNEDVFHMAVTEITERAGVPFGQWWMPTLKDTFDPDRPIIYNVGNFSPASVAGGSNGGNGAADAAISEWNAGVAAGAIYQLDVDGAPNWYVNATQAAGAAYLDRVFDLTKTTHPGWPGWLYIADVPLEKLALRSGTPEKVSVIATGDPAVCSAGARLFSVHVSNAARSVAVPMTTPSPANGWSSARAAGTGSASR